MVNSKDKDNIESLVTKKTKSIIKSIPPARELLMRGRIRINIENIFIGPGSFLMKTYPSTRTDDELREAYEDDHPSVEKLKLAGKQAYAHVSYGWGNPDIKHELYFSLRRQWNYWRIVGTSEPSWIA